MGGLWTVDHGKKLLFHSHKVHYKVAHHAYTEHDATFYKSVLAVRAFTHIDTVLYQV